MEVAEALSLITHAVASGTSRSYLVCGDLRGNCTELVDGVLEAVFPDQLEQALAHTHPDIAWLEPHGKSRTIKVERTQSDPEPGMRDGIIEPMSVTAFSGGWKVGVIAGADRMQESAANAFLKLLEEPPPKTLLLLLTDNPDALLPTIISRCQRIDLKVPSGELDGQAYDDVAEVFRGASPEGVFARAQAARRLVEILGELEDESEPENVPLVRKAFFRTILVFVRKWMESGALPRYQAYRDIGAVEEAYRQMESYVGAEAVIAFMMDRMFFPKPQEG